MKRIIVVIAIIFSVCAYAETEKNAIPSDTGMRLVWWPKVAPPKGWHFDQGSSYQFAFNAMAPDGATFSNAETVMYAKASYKPRVPDLKDLNSFVTQDLSSFENSAPKISIKNEAPMLTGDGVPLEVYSFSPVSEGNWEVVAYGEDAEYFLTFAISSRSQSGLASSLAALKQMVGNYRDKP